MTRNGKSAKATRQHRHGRSGKQTRTKVPIRGHARGSFQRSSYIKTRFDDIISPPESSDPPLHPIDQAVRDIAIEFRFTVEEVQEYYDRCGDPERTKNRFKKMRDVLNALKDDDDQSPAAPAPLPPPIPTTAPGDAPVAASFSV